MLLHDSFREETTGFESFVHDIVVIVLIYNTWKKHMHFFSRVEKSECVLKCMQ